MSAYHYNPTETREEFVHRKERSDHEFRRLVAKDKAGRRKRVQAARARHARKSHVHRY